METQAFSQAHLTTIEGTYEQVHVLEYMSLGWPPIVSLTGVSFYSESSRRMLKFSFYLFSPFSILICLLAFFSTFS